MTLFKTLPVVEAVCDRAALPPGSEGYARDTITLAWEERLRARGRRRSDGGFDFGTALPRGTVLRAGDCFVITDARLTIEVVEQLEAVFIIEPASSREWGLFAYHIGNGHQPLMIVERGLVCPDAPGVEMLLQYHRIPHTRAEMGFTPTTAFGHASLGSGA